MDVPGVPAGLKPFGRFKICRNVWKSTASAPREGHASAHSRGACRIRTLLRGVAGELGDLGLGRVLAQGTEQVTEVLTRDVTRARLVEERESLLVLSLRLRTVVSTGTRFQGVFTIMQWSM